MNKKPRILLVDDEPDLLKLLSMRLHAAGYATDTATSGDAALRRIEIQRPDLVISDLRMDSMDGLQLQGELQRRVPGLPVLLVTAYATIPDAVAATQRGAFGFLTKPVNKDELLRQIERALRTGGVDAERQEHWEHGIVHRSAVMRDSLAKVRRIAGSDSFVLIRGMSGTGKELIARAIHDSSPRRNQAFVALNCAAMPEALMEAELFGYERGSFTGATRAHSGLINAAHGGTLFLDEIGDMPLHLQVKLLRVLQDRRVRRVGGLKDEHVDLRVVSATHRDLEAAVASGDFREDLYYRLNVVSLSVPPLSERREDIPLLINHALEKFAAQGGGQRKVYAPEAVEVMVAADWPGNIRQLLNVVEQTVVLSPGQVISAAQVEQALGTPIGRLPSFSEAREAFTRQYLVQLLQITGGNISKAARLAQRNRTDFYKLLNRHSLARDQFTE